MKRILPFLLTLLLWAAPAAVKAQLTFTTNDGAITITGYIGHNPVGSLAIPASTNGLPVTDIELFAFYNATNLTSVTIPDSVVIIESNAFEECTSLTNVAIANGVAIIEGDAFYGCGSLASLILPGSVTNIGPYAFFECSNLASVTISNPAASVGNYAFTYCTSLASATVPGSLTNASYALDGCPNLTSITITDGSTNIVTEEFAFYFNNLVSVTIPDSVATIESNAFEECSSLASMTIPDSVATVGSNAFAYCFGLTNLTISNGPAFIDIGPHAFLFCTNLTSVDFPASVTNIGNAAFFGCSGLASVIVTNANASLGEGVFQLCSSLVSATIPGSVASAYDEFYGDPNQMSVTLSAGSTYVAVGEFSYLTNLADITIPDGVADIESNAFEECTSLVDVHLPASVTNIGSEAFLGCSNLASIEVDGSLAGIGYAAFADCDKLARVTIHGSVGSIGGQAFFGASNLVGVAIYGGVASLGEYAFLECVKLTSVLLGGNAPNVSTNGLFLFYSDRTARIYHFSGTTGWSGTFAELPDVTLKQPSGLLYVFSNGHGTFSPNDNGAVLTFGKSYTITAAPVSQDYIFFNWTGGTNAGSPTILSTNASYKFLMESNLTLTANFVTNLFLAAQGSYNGLFEVTNDAARQQTNSGSFTLKVTSAGSLTGDLYLSSPTGVALSGKFDPSGKVTITTKRSGKSPFTTSLILNTNNQTVSGTITDGSFVAQLSGNQSVFSTKNKSPYAGQYSVVIPGSTNAAIGPFGTSYGTVTVTSAGVITFAGSLADGTSVSQTSFVSQNGAWPFYLPLYGGNGSIFSWNYFPNQATNGTITLAAGASWINANNSSATAAYKAGFTNDAAVIYASAYTPNLLNLPDGMGQVVLEGGGLELGPSITNYITLGSNDKITVTTNVNKMVLMMNKANGLISGSFANELKTIKVNGVWFQSETNAQGYFLGADQTSGTFTLMVP